MSQSNLYPSKNSGEEVSHNSSSGAQQQNSLRQKIALSDLKYVQLLYKLIYTIGNVISRPRYFLVFTFARFNLVRQIFLFWSKLWFTSSETETTEQESCSLFPEVDPKKAFQTLRQDGMLLDLNLPTDFLEGLLQYISSQNCYAGGRPDLGFKIADKAAMDQVFPQPFYVARYFNVSRDCPQINQLVNDPKLREIASKYIGKPAHYTGSSLYWTFPIEGKSCDADQQKFRYFHYDIDDVSGLRFCFYLSDVTIDDGPHICIRGSHIKKSIWHVINFFSRIQSETELAKIYDEQQFITITGNSGFGFAEDTFCFHKGNPPVKQPRLFLQLHFAAHNYNQQQVFLDDRDRQTLKTYPLPATASNVAG
ncbi:MAG: hypothetical protein AAFQ80_23315 [Cyanobacteria bacterium J06621_8]